MKKWYVVVLAILLVSLPVLSACDLFGGKSKERKYYEQQLEAINKAQEAYQKQQEEYYKSLQEGFQQWAEEYNKWQQKQLQQQIQQVEEAEKAKAAQ